MLLFHPHQRVVAGEHLVTVASKQRRWLQIAVTSDEDDQEAPLETPSLWEVSHASWEQALPSSHQHSNPIAANGQVTYRASPTSEMGRQFLEALAVGQKITTSAKAITVKPETSPIFCARGDELNKHTVSPKSMAQFPLNSYSFFDALV